MRIGFVGAGRMGTPMVGRLVAAGHDVHLLVRSPEKRSAALALGGHPHAGVADTVEGADVVVVCVFDDEQVKRVCVEDGLLEAMQPGSVLVVHTTGSPNTARALAAGPYPVDVVDAPVSGGPHDVAASCVTLFVGGEDQAVARVTPALASYADPVLHVGPVGAGQLVKLVNNGLFAAQIGVVAEGVRLGRTLGVDESALLGALTHGSAQSRALSMIARAESASAFISSVGEFIGKDVAVMRSTVAELGGDLGLLDALVDVGLGS